MQCKTCSSSNVQRLSLFYWSLPAESPLRVTYAPPARVEANYWVALVAVVFGVGFVSSGEIPLGLVVAVAGLVWGAVKHAGVEAYRASMAEWSAAMFCLACPGRF